ncbi:MAG: hypothetical protein MK291_09815 [Planctomycetes bacterium]|nr:hypothetical protein [Planctomycetota bacterium]
MTESDGELGDLAMDEHSNELNLLSMTKIPRIDWSQVSGVRIDRSVPRGPGKLSPQVPDVSIEAVEYAGTLYKKLVAIDVSFTLTMEDGGAHSGVLSLRPVEGVLKILPAREAWD